MRSTFKIDLAHPAPIAARLAQRAGDSVAGWRPTGPLHWKVGTIASWKNVGKVAVEVTPKGEHASTLTFEIKRLGLVDPFGMDKNDYRDFYNKLEPLVRAETAKGQQV